jgi:hypothetical protein
VPKSIKQMKQLYPISKHDFLSRNSFHLILCLIPHEHDIAFINMSTVYDSRRWPHASKDSTRDKIHSINNVLAEALLIKCTLWCILKRILRNE